MVTSIGSGALAAGHRQRQKGGRSRLVAGPVAQDIVRVGLEADRRLALLAAGEPCMPGVHEFLLPYLDVVAVVRRWRHRPSQTGVFIACSVAISCASSAWGWSIRMSMPIAFAPIVSRLQGLGEDPRSSGERLPVAASVS